MEWPNMLELKGRFGKRVLKITGGHAQTPKVEEILKVLVETGKIYDTTNQIFDASRIAGKEHIVHAVKMALDAREAGREFADSPNIELICWTAGSKQIDLAIDRVGLREDTREVAVATVGKDREATIKSQEKILKKLQIDADEDVLKVDEKKATTIRKVFSLSKSQLDIAPLKEIMLERIALLSLEQ